MARPSDWSNGEAITASKLNAMIAYTAEVVDIADGANTTAQGYNSRISTLESRVTNAQSTADGAASTANAAKSAIDAARSPKASLSAKLDDIASNAATIASTEASTALAAAKNHTNTIQTETIATINNTIGAEVRNARTNGTTNTIYENLAQHMAYIDSNLYNVLGTKAQVDAAINGYDSLNDHFNKIEININSNIEQKVANSVDAKLNDVNVRLGYIDGGSNDANSKGSHKIRITELEKQIIDEPGVNGLSDNIKSDVRELKNQILYNPATGSSNIKSNVAALVTEVSAAHRQNNDTLDARFDGIDYEISHEASQNDATVGIKERLTSAETDIQTIATELGMLNNSTIQDTQTRIDNIQYDISHDKDIQNENDLGGLVQQLAEVKATADAAAIKNDVDSDLQDINNRLTAIDDNTNEESLISRINVIEDNLNTSETGINDRLTAVEALASNAASTLNDRIDTLETKDTIIISTSDFEALDLTASNININADYVVGPNAKGKYIYYRIIQVNNNLQKVMIGGAGSDPIILSELPTENIEENTDYYIQEEQDTYVHYRYENNNWIKIGGGTSAKVVNALPPINGTSNTDYYYLTQNGTYAHYRYINGTLQEVGSAGIDLSNYYTKDTIDTLFDQTRTNITNLNNDDKRYYAEYGTVTIEGVEQENMFVLYEYDKSDENRDHMTIVNSFKIVGGGGQAAASTLQVKINTRSPIICTRADKILIEIECSSVDEQSGADYMMTYTWREGTKILETGSLDAGIRVFDLTKYYQLSTDIGEHKVSLTIVDENGSSQTNTWRIEIVDVRLESDFNDAYAYPIGRTVRFSYTPYGSVDKTLHIKLDGQELESRLIPEDKSGTLAEYILAAQEHGAHLLECYLTATINNKTIETPHLFKDIIWFDSTSTIPVIGCIYRYDYYGKMDMQQYTTKSIPYVIYSPTSNNPMVTLTENGNIVNTLRLSTPKDSWAYKTGNAGDNTLTISCGVTSVTIVADVEQLKYNIEPITAGLVFDFNPNGYSNKNIENRLWHYTNEDSQTFNLTVSENFDWTNGGYQTDKNGRTYFCVRTGTRAYIDYNLFGTNPKEFGAEFKCIFKTTNVRTVQASFLKSKLETDNVGLVMKAHEAILSTADKSLVVPYSEEDIIEFEYNINPIEELSTDSYIMTYEDGVGSRPLIYENADRLYQNTNNKSIIEIGSDDCDVYIYRMKAYNTSLTDRNILNNFIADAADAEEMIARYERNQIYNENNILTPESVAAACPDLKVIMIEAPQFTNDKNNYIQNTTVRCIHTNGRARDNWTWENGFHVGQGTSSNLYGASGRNIDIIFGFDGQHTVVSKIKESNVQGYVSKITFADGTVLTGADAKVNLSDSSVENTWFNIKVNIASSENTNNALLQKRYNEYLPYTTPAKRRDPRIKNDMEFKNCVIFIRETDTTQDENGIYTTHREFPYDTQYHFYGIGNIGDSKKTDNTRVNDPTDLKEFCIEVSDNNLPNSMFQTGVYRLDDNSITYDPTGMGDAEKMRRMVYPITEEQWNNENNLSRKSLSLEGYVSGQKLDDETGEMKDIITNWDSSFEFRYDMGTKDGETMDSATIKAQQIESKLKWNEMYKWVVTSSNSDFVTHFSDWFITESPLFWYLFTERYIMIDNRAKNSFYHYGKFYISESEAAEMGEEAQYYIINNEAAAINNGYRFELWDYDNDTALGIDNSGMLTIPYGKEDIDKNELGENYYNAAENIFWRRIRTLMNDQLTTLYNSSRLSACWSASNLITEFDNWQNQFAEELWRLDIERKYIRPYKEGSWDQTNKVYKTVDEFLKDKANGRKRYQRRQFERDQEIYLATKYLQAAVLSDTITMRLAAGDEESVQIVPINDTISITPYSDMYIRVMFGNNAGGGSTVSYRAKAGIPKDIAPPFSFTSRGTLQIAVYAASRIQGFNDLSAFYIKDNDFSKATKLKTLIIGNSTPGYKNTAISGLTLGDNVLLETLNIENCPNLAGALNLSKCQNLVTLNARNTSITSVTFPTNGIIQSAYLPGTITSLKFKSIKKLTNLEIASYNHLESFSCDDSEIINPRAIINLARNTLREIELLNIDWTHNKDGELTSTNLLDYLVTLYTVDNLTGAITKNAKASGVIEIIPASGKVYASAKAQYEEFFGSDLEILVDDNDIQKQLHVVFINTIPTAAENDQQSISYVEDSRILYEAYIDATPGVPTHIFGDNGLHEDPASNPNFVFPTHQDVRYNYTFGTQTSSGYRVGSGWITNLTQQTPINFETDTFTWTETYQEMKYYACYKAVSRRYLVKWWGASTTEPIASDNVIYGQSAVFPTNAIYPTIKIDSDTGCNQVFLGWNKSTFKITEETDVQSLWSNPARSQGQLENYVATNHTLTGLEPQDLYTYAQMASTGNIDNNTCATVLDDSHFEMIMGNDFEFNNVVSQTIFDIDHPRYFEQGGLGSAARYPASSTDLYIKPFKLTDSGESRPFTLVIDFKFNTINDESVLVSCFDKPYKEDGTIDQNTGRGFQLIYNAIQQVPVVTWGTISSGGNNWPEPDRTINNAENAVKVGHAYNGAHSRNIVVLRYPGNNSKSLYVYYDYDEKGTAQAYSDKPVKQVELKWEGAPEAIASDFADTTLKFGYSYKIGDNYNNSSSGAIYWAKIWYDDLGENICKQLAAWPRERITMKLTGIYNAGGEYITLPTTGDKYKMPGHANLQFTALNLLQGVGHSINNPRYGWAENVLKIFLNDKFYNGIPFKWRSVIMNTLIPNSDVEVDFNGSFPDITVNPYSFNTYIYIPAYGEYITANSQNTYQNNIINNESKLKRDGENQIERIIDTNGNVETGNFHPEDLRIKFKFFTIPDNARYYAITDTSLYAGTATLNPFDPHYPEKIKRGDIWLREIYREANNYNNTPETSAEAYIFIDLDDIKTYHPFIKSGYECRNESGELVGAWFESNKWPLRTSKVSTTDGLLNGAEGFDERGIILGATKSISFAEGICIGFAL